jgi:hypothetical protein
MMARSQACLGRSQALLTQLATTAPALERDHFHAHPRVVTGAVPDTARCARLAPGALPETGPAAACVRP